MANGFMTKADVERLNEMRENEAKNGPFYAIRSNCEPIERKQTMLNQTANRDAKILQWQEAVKALAAAKDAEAALRKEVLTECYGFDPEALREGTENVELGNGYKLKAVFKISRTMNNADDAVDKVLTKIEKTGPEGQFIAERLVKWKPELSVSEYKKLPEKFRKMIDEVVVSKEATPALELVEPKAK